MLKIDFAFNKISDIWELGHFENLKYLIEADFSGNTIHNQIFYKQVVLKILPHLRKLDGNVISIEELVKNDLFFGIYEDKKKLIFS